MDFRHIFLLLFYIVIPVMIIYLEGKYSIVKKAGAVLICYVTGALMGNIGLFPAFSPAYLQILKEMGVDYLPFDKIKQLAAAGQLSADDVTRNGISFLQNNLTNVSVLLALPLILFSMDVKSWFNQAGHAILSLAIGLVTVIGMIFIGYWMFKGDIEDIGNVGGMLVGIYTGGTPNMAAIKTALGVSNEIYLLTHTYEMFLGAIYLVFIFSIGQKVFLLFLPPFKSLNNPGSAEMEEVNLNLEKKYESYEGIFKRSTFLPLLAAFGLSVVILGVSFIIGSLFPKEYTNTVIVLMVTSFGIAGSFIPKIKNIKMTFQAGMYIILIFCLSVASMADASKLANISLSLFYFVGIAMFGSHFLHALIARFFKIDADTVIISGSALICSPPFVPVVAASLRNREIIMTGLTVGIAGYAVGNFLGILVAGILNSGIF